MCAKILKKIILLFFVTSLSNASDDFISEARKALINNNIHEVEKNLQKMTRSHQDFLIAIHNLEKIYFKKKKWSMFFGTMAYYKNNYLNPYKIKKEYFIPEILILESLALNKLCRWRDALGVIVEIKKISNLFNLEVPLAAFQAEIYIAASLRTEEFEKNKTNSMPEFSHVTTDSFWRIYNNQLDKIDNPIKIRMNVRSLCTK